MSGAAKRPDRVRTPYVEQLAERLSSRDWMILNTLDRLRLATGPQLERLHFSELTGRSRSVKRGQVLKQLVGVGAIVPLERRIGTANRGSAQQRYALDSGGRRLLRLRATDESLEARVRRPRIPSDRLTKHTLAVSELYVELVERSHVDGFSLGDFQVEGNAYWPDGFGGWMKPDAFVRLESGKTIDYWWYEADMPRHDSDLANESLPTIRSKCLAYLDFVRRGQLGPDDVVPRVAIGEPSARQRDAVQAVVDALPAPAEFLFTVAELGKVAQIMLGELAK
jgi:hypothetical protein